MKARPSTYSACKEHPRRLEIQEEIAQDEGSDDRKRSCESFQDVVSVFHDNSDHQTTNSLQAMKRVKIVRVEPEEGSL